MFDLLLQLEDLLGEQIDFQVLLIDFSRQIQELTRAGGAFGRGLSGGKSRQQHAHTHERKLVGEANHRPSLASPFGTGKLRRFAFFYARTD